jgi:hypothetical protein
MKKIKIIIAVVVLFSVVGCSTSRPVYNSDKESLSNYQKNVQKYYTKKLGK